ncbi:MAG: DUF1631 family protein [Rhodanobacter sp.]|nr:MAG: DUF1631 family protein [Rhodanobacter sp.]TAL89540.1 MAG: DUF1631 family protein [Rhodanobacter sp.]TAM41911.1 MAG: DUF1631 family protein [Rhodanobacter sp.]TAN29200.1 MAG: DUF1631 family protein [Rhodanobacter sp.]
MNAGQDLRRPPGSHSADCLQHVRWPARAQQLIETSYSLCVEGLHEPVRHCLREFERQLFTLADHAQRSDEQHKCFASRQCVLQGQNRLAQSFMEQVGKGLSELDRTADPSAEASAEVTPWHTLELLDPSVQEISMALEQVGARGDTRHRRALYELGYRLAVLIGSPPLEGPGLPLGPYALAKAFQHASTELGLALEHQVLLLQHFDRSVLPALAGLYSAINLCWQSDGILPQLRSVPAPRHVNRHSRPGMPEATPASEPAATESASKPQGGGPGEDSIHVLESLRDLLAQRRGGQRMATGEIAGQVASEDELQLALGALQQHLAQVTDHASRELRSAGRLREELLAQLNLGQPADAPRTQLSSEQGDTVELVAGLFEQLGQQLQHGGNARSLLHNLQLPVLRVAVADHSFFEKRDHPARQLLDTVTAVANDWLDGSDDESNRPLATKLEQLVNRANQEPPSAGLYTTLLADIEHHLALLTRKAQAAERRHVEAAQGRERLDQARHRAGTLMAERFAQSPPRGLLRALLDRAWSDVLALTLLRHGEDSAAFRTQLAITDQLLGRLPTPDHLQLQQEVESGLQQIGMHAQEAVQVAQRLLGAGTQESAVELPSATDLALRLKQHQRLGEQHADPAPAPASPAVKSVKPAAVAKATTLSPPAPETGLPAVDPRELHIEQHLRKLPFGSWFEFVDPTSGQIARRKLVWYSPISGRCLLVSRRGQRGEEMSMAQLAHEIASGRACEVPAESESLLDRAWRSFTGNLRQSAALARSAKPVESRHR